jgi:hypothetical protein
MYRIAYIISAYTDVEHLKCLMKSLDYESDFYIHVDKKSDVELFRREIGERAVFVDSRWISWGGWSQVEYQRDLLKAVLESGKQYSRVVCLSGQDYPLWSKERIRRFFTENADREYICGWNISKSTDKGQRSKIVNYHFFRDLEWKNTWLKNKFIVGSRLLLRYLPFRRSDRVVIGGKPCDVYIGSDYWSLTIDCCRYVYSVLTSEKKLVNYFKTTFTPSEMCIQTIVFNSQFREKAILFDQMDYPSLSALTPLHYIDYRGKVAALDESYYPVLSGCGKMFCRKVVTGKSDKLLMLLPINEDIS